MSTSTRYLTISQQFSAFFINRKFAYLWSGLFVSSIGDAVFDTTIILWITASIARQQTWAALAVSGVFLSISIPSLFISPIAGVFIDRWDKRRTMLIMDGLRALFIALLCIISLFPLQAIAGNANTRLWPLAAIYLVTFLASACSQFFSPAEMVLIRTIVPEQHLEQASARNQMIASLSLVIGAPIATALFFNLGVEWALIVNAFSFLVSLFCVLAIRISPPLQPEEIPGTENKKSATKGQVYHFLADFSAGFRFFFDNRILRTILISLVLILLGSTATNVLSIFFLEQNLHAPGSLYGIYTAVAGIGAIISSLIAGWLVKRLGIFRSLWLTPLIFGVVMVFNARLSNFYVALPPRFLLGMPGIIFNVAVMPLIFRITPRDFIGRAASIFTPVVTISSMLAMLLSGYLNSTILNNFHMTLLGISIGPIDTIFTGSGALMIIAGLFTFMSLRSERLAAEEQAPQDIHASKQQSSTIADDKV